MADQMTVHGIHHVCMKVADIGRAVDFYTGRMGYAVRMKWDGGAMLRAPDGTYLEFFPEDKAKGYEHVAYCSDDVDADYRIAREAGCEGVIPPKDVTMADGVLVHIAFFRDPNGCLIELFDEKG